ncbi:MAG: bifunctional phosphoglucose/phosphomannose isomerase [Candidatus Pacebacteria bacterium]|nr:bifunctional phosphoglucose/phosphomannose isomerase [Candidatus Paceibacterota bacterium]
MKKDTSILNSAEEMEILDKSNTKGSIEQFAQQAQHIWQQAQSLRISGEYKQVKNIVVGGMGGSALGTHVIQTVFKDEIKLPITIVPDYDLPAFVNEQTLFVASSYSGTTEETLASTKQALERGAKVTGITSGGELAKLLKANNAPALVFTPTYNPSGQPRMALGYSIFGQIALLSQLGVLNVTNKEVDAVLAAIADVHLRAGLAVAEKNNPAKLLAYQFSNRIPIITVAEHLEGVAHVFANQLNENAKTYSEFRVVPEINHHLLEGLQFPKNRDEVLFFFAVLSKLYQPSNRKRMKLTQEILQNNHIEYQTLELSGKTKLEQAFELLTFGAYVTYYLAMLHHLDPAPIPVVDWFKNKLKD